MRMTVSVCTHILLRSILRLQINGRPHYKHRLDHALILSVAQISWLHAINTQLQTTKVLTKLTKHLKYVSKFIFWARMLCAEFVLPRQEQSYLNIFVSYVKYTTQPVQFQSSFLSMCFLRSGRHGDPDKSCWVEVEKNSLFLKAGTKVVIFNLADVWFVFRNCYFFFTVRVKGGQNQSLELKRVSPDMPH